MRPDVPIAVSGDGKRALRFDADGNLRRTKGYVHPDIRRTQACLGMRIRKGLPCQCGHHDEDA